MIRVLLVDDRSILSQGLRMLLSAEPDIEVVAEAVDGRAAVALATGLDPQVALVDADMGHGQGFAAARALRAACPQVHIVLLSLHDDPEIRSGAGTFVSKQSPTEMLAAIRNSGRSV